MDNKRDGKHYLTNANMIAELEKCREQNRVTENFGKMIILLADRISSRPNFSGYTFVDDMRNAAVLNIIKSWRSFDINKSSNPFTYFSTYIFNSFIQYIKSEKKMMNIKNKMLVDHGLNPSFSYSEEHSNKSEDGLSPKLLFDPKEVFENPTDDVQKATFEANYNIEQNDNNSIHIADGLYRVFELNDTKINYSNDGNIIKILSIKTPFKQRNQGSAKSTFSNFLSICDNLKINTQLSYNPLDDSTDENKLFEWFSNLGYSKESESSKKMIRNFK